MLRLGKPATSLSVVPGIVFRMWDLFIFGLSGVLEIVVIGLAVVLVAALYKSVGRMSDESKRN